MLVAVTAVAVAFFFVRHQSFKRVEESRQKLYEKIQLIKNGMDADAVVQILGRPTSESHESDQIFENKIKAPPGRLMVYRYHLFIGRLPFTVEGGSRVNIAIYFDEETKKVVQKTWFIF